MQDCNHDSQRKAALKIKKKMLVPNPEKAMRGEIKKVEDREKKMLERECVCA